MNISFKIAKLDDVMPLAEMCGRWAVDMGYELSTDAIAIDIERTVNTGVVIASLCDGELIGMMSGVIANHFWIGEEWAHEHWFFVHPKYRKMGIGDGLQKAFCKWAEMKGCKSVMVTPNKFGSLNPKVLADHLEKVGYELHGYMMRKEV